MSTNIKALKLIAGERPLSDVKYNRDGDLLFTTCLDGVVSVWSTETGERLGTFCEDIPVKRMCKAVDVTLDSSQIVVATSDKLILYDSTTGRLFESIDEVAIVSDCEWNRDPENQNKILTCHGSTGGIRSDQIPAFKIYSTPNKNMPQPGEPSRPWTCSLIIESFQGKPITCRWGPFDKTVLGATESGFIYQWDLQGKELNSVRAHKDSITAISLNSTRTLMVTSSLDETLALWSVPTLKLIRRYESGRPLRGCAMHPHFDHPDPVLRKPYVATAGGQDSAKVTTTASSSGFFETLIINMVFGTEVGSISDTHFSPTNCLDFHPDGISFVTGAEEGMAKIHKFEPAFIDANHNTC